MALTKAQRAERRDRVLRELRRAWTRHDARGRPVRVELTLQRRRRHPRVSGVVSYVATSGAFVLLRDDDWQDGADGYRMAPTLHVPVDVIRNVRWPT